MKAFYLFLVLTLLSSSLYSQQKSNCEIAFEKLSDVVEKDYPGFSEKTKDSVAYQYFKASLLDKVKRSAEKDCFQHLKDYISYFRDGHIFFLDEASYLRTAKINKIETLKTNEQLLRKLKASGDSLEGVWKNEEFKVGIVKQKSDQYKGFILASSDKNWKVGDVLFTLEEKQALKLFNTNLTAFLDTYTLKNSSTLYFNKTRNYFIKDNLDTLNANDIANSINKLLGIYVEKLTKTTTLIKLKNFDYPFVERIEKLITDNKVLIGDSENLIIDLRDNGGGTTDAFVPLLPYIMTGNTRRMNIEYWISDFLISGMEKYRNGLAVNAKNEANRERIEKLLGYYKQNIGKFVLNPGTKAISIDTVELVKNNIKQIVFLTNKKIGSAAESLLLLAKQSKKVKLMGTPTQGVLDYANAYLTSYEYDGHPLILPTYRSLRLPDFPIDNIGIQPDVYLDNSVADWVKLAISYLESNMDL